MVQVLPLGAASWHLFSLLCAMFWMVPKHAQYVALALKELTVQAHWDTE